MCGNYSREETIQGRKLYEEIRYFIILIRFLQIEKFTAMNIHEMRCKAKMTLFSSKFAASLNFAQALLGLIAIPDNID